MKHKRALEKPPQTLNTDINNEVDPRQAHHQAQQHQENVMWPWAVATSAIVLGIAIGYSICLQTNCAVSAGSIVTSAEISEDAFASVENYKPMIVKPSKGPEKIIAFFGIISAPANEDKRATLRQTWLNAINGMNTSVQYRFYVGRSKYNAALASENITTGDIVLLPLDDSYETLSSKVPAAIRHASRNFPEILYFVKIDDDTFVDVPGLIEKLVSLNTDPLYLGATWSGSKPHRNSKSKHYLPTSLFPKAMANLPPYNEGGCYVLSSSLIKYIDRNRKMLKPLGPLEDVTIALWLLPLQVHPTSEPRFVSKNLIAGQTLTVRPELRQKYCRDDLLVMPDVDVGLMHDMWDLAERGWGLCSALSL